jgi:D-alanyl-lipoteichoic acid acyltransferase DltB (MBOAT superfamily)
MAFGGIFLFKKSMNMNSKVLLRVAVALVLIHLLGHTIGHLGWDKPQDNKMQAVVSMMKTHQAEFMGASKSMSDYYRGYSLMIFGLFGMTISILWFASGFIANQRAIAKKILVPIGIAYVFFGIVEFICFFPFAAGVSFISGLLTLAAALKKD